MAISNSKRNLLRGRISKQNPLRPPWSVTENEFVELCNRCGECAKGCPAKVIKMSDGGFPEIDFSSSGCNFCKLCVESCEAGALKYDRSAAFKFSAGIEGTCFSIQGVVCRACGECCEVEAIRFQPALGGITNVLLDTDLCNGCGECVSLCPAKSISLKHRQ